MRSLSLAGILLGLVIFASIRFVNAQESGPVRAYPIVQTGTDRIVGRVQLVARDNSTFVEVDLATQGNRSLCAGIFQGSVDAPDNARYVARLNGLRYGAEIAQGRSLVPIPIDQIDQPFQVLAVFARNEEQSPEEPATCEPGPLYAVAGLGPLAELPSTVELPPVPANVPQFLAPVPGQPEIFSGEIAHSFQNKNRELRNKNALAGYIANRSTAAVTVTVQWRFPVSVTVFETGFYAQPQPVSSSSFVTVVGTVAKSAGGSSDTTVTWSSVVVPPGKVVGPFLISAHYFQLDPYVVKSQVYDTSLTSWPLYTSQGVEFMRRPINWSPELNTAARQQFTQWFEFR